MMRFTFPRIFFLFLIIIPSNVITFQNKLETLGLRVRVRRQDGYVYNKPNVSFDLPSRPNTDSTQAQIVNRTMTQNSLYAYPAPASDGNVNAGSTVDIATSAGAISASSSGVTTGYNHKSSSQAGSGYGYGPSGSSGFQENIKALVTTNTGTQITATNALSDNISSSQSSSGYNKNVPSPTLSPTLQEPPLVSTSAPRYLPPITGDGNGSFGATGTVGTSGQVDIPSNNYLAPLSNNIVSTGQTKTSISSGSQTSIGGSNFVPNVAYLPALSSAAVLAPSPFTTTKPSTPTGAYIPPSNTGTNSDTVSTPAPGYLPPVLF